MKFKENYIRKIIQEEISNLQKDEADESPVEIDRNEMAKVFANIDHIIHSLTPSIPADSEQGLAAINDLEKLWKWFNIKLTGGEDPEGMEWLREPLEGEERTTK